MSSMPPGNRFRTGPPHRRPERCQAGRGHCAAQPLAPPAGGKSPCATRSRPRTSSPRSAPRACKDRNRAAPGAPGRCALHQGRGHQVHRGGLCGQDVDTIIRDLAEWPSSRRAKCDTPGAHARLKTRPKTHPGRADPAGPHPGSEPRRQHRAPGVPQEAARGQLDDKAIEIDVARPRRS